MAYKIRLTAPAEADAYAVFERIREVAPASAERWLKGLFKEIFNLAALPKRCALIPEAAEIGLELRHLLYGKGTGVYRVIFDIQEDSVEGPRIRILRVWHGSRDRLRAEDLEIGSDSL